MDAKVKSPGMLALGTAVFLLLLAVLSWFAYSRMDTESRRRRVSKELTTAKENILNGVDADASLMRLRRGAKSSYGFEKMYAVGTIGQLGPKASGAMPELLEALQATEDLYVLREAAIAAGKMGKAGAPAVPILAGMLAFPEYDYAWFAAESLGELAPDAIAAVPNLRAAARSSNPTMREEARRALLKLTGSPD